MHGGKQVQENARHCGDAMRYLLESLLHALMSHLEMCWCYSVHSFFCWEDSPVKSYEFVCTRCRRVWEYGENR